MSRFPGQEYFLLPNVTRARHLLYSQSVCTTSYPTRLPLSVVLMISYSSIVVLMKGSSVKKMHLGSVLEYSCPVEDWLSDVSP